MWKLFHLIQMFLIVLVTLICGLLGTLLMLITSPKWVMGIFPKRVWSPFVFWVFGVRLNVTGLENTDSKETAIYVANHASPLDIPALFMAMPVAGYFVAKRELKKIPFMGWFMTVSGMIFIDRTNRESAMKSMHKAGKQIKKGKNVIAFPEGTRSRTGEMQQFKRGSFVMAKEADIPVQPCIITGAFARMKPKSVEGYPGVINVHFLPRERWDAAQYTTPEEFANRTQEKVKLYHDQMA